LAAALRLRVCVGFFDGHAGADAAALAAVVVGEGVLVVAALAVFVEVVRRAGGARARQ